MNADKDFYEMFKPAVFEWLKSISRGTNKSAVEDLLNPEGISYVFDLPKEISQQFFDEWESKNHKTQTP